MCQQVRFWKNHPLNIGIQSIFLRGVKGGISKVNLVQKDVYIHSKIHPKDPGEHHF